MAKTTLIPYSNFYNPKQKLKILQFSIFKELAKEVMYTPHRLDFYGIVHIDKGEGTHQLGDKIYTFEAGDVLLLSPGQLHSFIAPANFEARILSFNDDFFMTTLNTDFLNENYEILSNFTDQSLIRSTEENRDVLSKILDIIAIEATNTYDASQTTILQHLLSSYLHILSRVKFNKQQVEKRHTGWEKRVGHNFKVLLRTGIYRNYTIKQYLEMLGVSQSTLQLATKKTFDKTPKNIIDEAIIFEAKRQLLNPQKRIQEISYALGFTEPTNFSKFFKKKTGMTPEAYRKGD